MLALRLPSKPQVLIMLLGDGDFLNAAYLYLSMFLSHSMLMSTQHLKIESGGRPPIEVLFETRYFEGP